VTIARIAFALLATVAWLPVLAFFFRNFKTRNNPVSLAIGTLVALSMLYVGPVDYWLTSGTANKEWVSLTFDILSVAVCIHFYLAIRWSRKRFQDTRRSPG
jgi:hypothetical protein